MHHRTFALTTTMLAGLLHYSAGTFADSLPPPPANSGFSLTSLTSELESLLLQRQFSQAYELAHQHLHDAEGEPGFDFLLGLAALEAGHIDEALFVFERLNESTPTNLRYQFELARCHFLLGNFPQANALFSNLTKNDLPDDIHQTVRRYQRQIHRQSRWQTPSWSVSLAAAAGYDTNTNTATDEDRIDVLDGQFTAILDEDQQSLSSGYYRLSGSGRFMQPYSKNHQLELTLSGNRKDNAGTDKYDLDSVLSDLEYRYRSGNRQVFLGGYYQFHWLGREGLQSRWQGRTGFYYSPSSLWQHRLTLSVNGRDNRLNDELDNWYPELSLETRTLVATVIASVRLLAALDQEDEPLARDVYGGDLSLGYQWSAQKHLQLMLQYRLSDYHQPQSDNSLFSPGETRTEHLSQISLRHNHHLWSVISLHAQYSYIRNHSTLQIYQYDRSLIEAGLSIRF